MTGSIERDKQRFLDITRQKTRKRLKEAMKKGELIGKKDGKKVKVPYDYIELPRIRYGSPGQGGGDGVGQGDAEEGDVLADPQEGDEPGQAGNQPGEHLYEDFDLSEIAKELAKELELPRIEPKGKRLIYSTSEKLKTINTVGPPGRLHKKRTFKNALKRNLASRTHTGFVVPIRADKRYRTFKPEYIPEMNAVIFYMMDISGSMGEEQKLWSRTLEFWIDLWLSDNYKNLESRYIVHETHAWEVTREDFFYTRESGGTMISSVFKKQAEIMHNDYNPEEWNIYLIYCSDGDNWNDDDTRETFRIMDEHILPYVNMIGYAQTTSRYGSGNFLKELTKHYNLDDDPDSKILTTKIESHEDIMKAMKDLFGKGK
ncbi:DUF444 family protein [Candidatus Woesearchaeota archaeon]|nr:MAG: DUF444 family protein [Candidatus Woesearchaeota archaeon]